MSYVATAFALVGQDALSALLVAVLALGPGWLLARGIARRLAWPLSAAIPTSLAITTTLVALGALAGLPAGSSGLAVAIGVTLVLAAAASWLGWRIGEGFDRIVVDGEGLACGGIAALIAIIVGPYMGLTADTFYHLAAADSLLAGGRSMVTDPMYGTVTRVLDPTSGAWHTMLAIMSRITTVTPDLLWGGLTAVAAACLVLGFRSMVRAATGSERAATIATVAWIGLVLFADFRMAAYPKLGSLAIVFIALAALIELAHRPSWTAAGMAACGGLAAASAHLGSAQLLYVSVAAVWAWSALDAVAARRRGEPAPYAALRAVTLTALAIAAIAAVLVLPRLGALGGGGGLVDLDRDISGSLVHWPGGIVTAEPGAFMGGSPWLSVLLFVAVALAAVDVLGPARRREGLGALAIASLPLLTIYDPVFATLAARFSPYVFSRIGALFDFTPYVALAWLLARPVGAGRWRWTPRAVAALMLLSALVFGAPLLAGTFVKAAQRRGNRHPVYVSRLKDIRVEWGVGLRRVRDAVADRPDGATVAGSPETSYYIAGLVEGARIVAAPRSHSPYVVEQASGERRRADMARLLDPATSRDEARSILVRYGATVLVFDRGVPAEATAFRALSALGRARVVTGRLSLIEVGRTP